mgnify:CR=1 FL=1
MEPDSGKVNIGDTVVFGNFSQEGLVYKNDVRVIEYVKDIAENFPLASGGTLSAAQFLELFLFTPDKQYTFLSALSGGEKKRLQLLSVLFRNPNFLILDEPTNDLDLPTLGVLEDFLLEYQGCVMLVSHDRYFMDKLVDHVFVFEGEGRVRDFPGNYTEYRTWKEWDESQKDSLRVANKGKDSKSMGVLKERNDVGKKSGTLHGAVVSTEVIVDGNSENAKSEEKRKLSFKEKFEFEQLGKEIEALEARKKVLESELSGLTVEFERISSLSGELQIVNDTLDEKGLRWLELGEWI